MKNAALILTLICSILCGTHVYAADALEQGFFSPPAQAKPWIYWCWLNGNITKEGITADLEAMKKTGMGGMLLLNLAGAVPAGPVKMLSDEWRDCMSYAAAEAKRLGLSLSIMNDYGAVGAGGPWIKPEESMQILTWSETATTGSGRFSGTLKKPFCSTDYYRDVAVLAFPTPGGGKPFASFNPKITANIAGFDGKNLTDGDPDTRWKLSAKERAELKYIQIEFPAPFTAQTLVLEFGGSRAANTIGVQISNDGTRFTSVADVSIGRNLEKGYERLKGLCRNTIQFPPSTGRFFRISFPDVSDRQKKLEIADIRLLSTPRIRNAEHKGGFVTVGSHGSGLSFLANETVPAAGIAPERIIDLTGKMSAGGVLTWDVPAGEWTILRIGHTPTVQRIYGPDKEESLDCDKLDPKGIEAQFARYIDPLIAKSAPLDNALRDIHIDSWESGPQNWTGIFREEFKKRRGYDLLPYLPVIAGGFIVTDSKSSERFLRDFRVTIAELIRDNYYGRARELCHQRGLHLSAEASGPQQYLFDGLGYQSKTDVPMGEFWTHEGNEPEAKFWTNENTPYPDNKIAASAAHTCNLPFTAAEAFTGADKFTAYPFSVKSLGDLAFCLGINRLTFHVSAHQPWMNIAPGMEMSKWGLSFVRTQTWWDQGAPWIDYITRSQYLLQQGLFVADIVCLTGENVPNKLYFKDPRTEFKPAIPAGYDYDGCADEVFFKNMKVVNGRLVLPHGMSYSLLLLPDSTTMTPERARTIKNLVAAGATVVGPKPDRSPSLSGFPSCDAEVKKIADEVWGPDGAKDHVFGKGHVRAGTFEEIFRSMNLAPDFECAASGTAEINYIHRIAGNADIYFLANRKDRVENAVCTFRVTGKVPEFWHPDTGIIEPCAVYEAVNGRIRIPVHFDRRGSVFVIFRSASKKGGLIQVRRNGLSINDLSCRMANDAVSAEFKQGGHYEFVTAAGTKTFDISVPEPMVVGGPWEVSFLPKLGAPEKAVFQKLISWPEHSDPGIKYFSGTATYRTAFDCPAELIAKDRRLYLDLGDVQVSAEVILNGRNLGVCWKPPFRADITDVVKPGSNALEVKVVNLWPNRLIGDEQLPEDCKHRAEGPSHEWPDWLVNHTPRTSGRIAFSTWKHWNKDDKLLPSGLLGPVTIQAAEVKKIKL